MINKSSISDQIISLPKGGGALKGIGEKFSPNPFMGTGSFTIPVSLPPGRNGFQPALNLIYSSGNGNGPFGLGWSLSIPGIHRKTSKGVPQYKDNSLDSKERDIFILSGVDDLVPISSVMEGQTRYHPRTEGLYAKIIHHKDSDNDYWEIRNKDGIISYYGTPNSAGNDSATICDPADRKKVFSWKLSLTKDTFGNRIEYEYFRDSKNNGVHNWDQLYLKEIRYLDYLDVEITKFLITVTFIHEDRPDRFSMYRSGFEIRTEKRYNKIEIRSHANENQIDENITYDPSLIKTIHFRYLDQQDGCENNLPKNGVSLLSQVKIIGHDGENSQEIPPIEFKYTKFDINKRIFFPLKGLDLPAFSLSNPNLELVDLFGNGLPDILEMNGVVRYWRNLGNGEFDLPRNMNFAPAGLNLAHEGVQLIDADGNGRSDLMVTFDNLAGYYPLRFGGSWDTRSFQSYQKAPSFNLKDPEVRLVDLDGDGITDAIRSGTRLECFFNHPKDGWNKTRFIPRQIIEEFPNINFSDSHVKLGDLNGDGLQDIVFIHDRNVEYWPNIGHGSWGKRIPMKNCPEFPYDYNPNHILLGDIDGDGLDDLIYVENMKITLWINMNGNKWSNPIQITGTPPISDIDALRLVDILGIGTRGILWSKNATTSYNENYYFLDLTGGIKSYLLNEMKNNIGAITRLEYVSSTKFYLDDEMKLETHSKTPLPFPIPVVSRVEVIDAISKGKLTTEYTYHHGYWDGVEREFCGFGRVDQRDTEIFEEYNSFGLHPEMTFENVEELMFSPPVETRTWYHQGPIEDEYGKWCETDFTNEFWSEDPQVLGTPDDVLELLKNLDSYNRREAIRAKRGQIIRSEVYALDNNDLQDRPYIVKEYLYGLRHECSFEVDHETSPNIAQNNCFKIFFSYIIGNRITQWERGYEPMTRIIFFEDYDLYGQHITEINIAVPRGRNFKICSEVENPYLATLKKTKYATKDLDNLYIINRIASQTSYEIINDGKSSLIELLDGIKRGLFEKKVISQTLNFYDGPAFEGLDLGQIGLYGALVRTETLILTEDIIYDAYKTGNTILDPPEMPPFLAFDGQPMWTAEYPLEFRDKLIERAGYIYHTENEGSEYISGYYTNIIRKCFDFHDNQIESVQGVVIATLDSLGHETKMKLDSYNFFLVEINISPVLITHAKYNYRSFQVKEIMDPNGNRITCLFTPLGDLERIASIGKEGETIGDTLDKPNKQYIYEYNNFLKSEKPIFIRTIQRVNHINDQSIPFHDQEEKIEIITYTDGFGRIIQSRKQAENIIFGETIFGDNVLPSNQNDQNPTEANIIGQSSSPEIQQNVIVSGWQVYNNKGQIIKKYLPFFSKGWDYLTPMDESQIFGNDVLREKIKMFYDPIGKLIRIINPDRSERKIIFGIPDDILNPDYFTPTPWEFYIYDENDNSGRTHHDESIDYQLHWNTPQTIILDALGRQIKIIERNRSALLVEECLIQYIYDIKGNLLNVINYLNQTIVKFMYDLNGSKPIRIDQLDKGIERVVFDAMGNEIERRDSKGALILQVYDDQHRPIYLWARDADNEQLKLQRINIYGDSQKTNLSLIDVKSNNLLGELYKIYDEAGLVINKVYDFKGNILEWTRQFIDDNIILSVLENHSNNLEIHPYQVDWQPTIGMTFIEYENNLLDKIEYRISRKFDALNRVKALRYPKNVKDSCKDLFFNYNSIGLLENIKLDDSIFVKKIAYNANGQRTMILYGNNIMTRYAYEQKTNRLKRLKTESYEFISEHIIRPLGSILQDFLYIYDQIGNIIKIHDHTPECGIPNTVLGINKISRTFKYDSLYRLIFASGRECGSLSEGPPWEEKTCCDQISNVYSYIERYQYDPANNMIQLDHNSNENNFTREFSLVPNSNRLSTLITRTTNVEKIYNYVYDNNGNIISEANHRYFKWDFSDRLKFYHQCETAFSLPISIHYLYNLNSYRVKKIVKKKDELEDDIIEVSNYINGIFEHHYTIKGKSVHNYNILHIMDNIKRIATVRIDLLFPYEYSPEIQYHINDHLNSSNLVINEKNTWINREEYTPFGETCYGSFSNKCYRFTGKLLDKNSGLYYYNARYYAPWLSRWVSCDPLGIIDGLNLYSYTQNNPLNMIDPNGTFVFFFNWEFSETTNSWNMLTPISKKQVNTQKPKIPREGRRSFVKFIFDYIHQTSGDYKYSGNYRRVSLAKDLAKTGNYNLFYGSVFDTLKQNLDLWGMPIRHNWLRFKKWEASFHREFDFKTPATYEGDPVVRWNEWELIAMANVQGDWPRVEVTHEVIKINPFVKQATMKELSKLWGEINVSIMGLDPYIGIPGGIQMDELWEAWFTVFEEFRERSSPSPPKSNEVYDPPG